MERVPFSQTFVGAVLVAVLAGLIVWFLTGHSHENNLQAPGVVVESLAQRNDTTAAVYSNAPTRQPLSGSALASNDSAPRNAPRLTSVQCVEAVIDDSDHYTNIRREAGAQSDIVGRVVEGEVFCVTSQYGRWWTVQTSNSVTGYMFYDRIRVLRPGKQ